jgi:hypothetical protein
MFNIENSADYYAMLVEDFDEFMNESGSARRAIHCAITCHHLAEWVWHDWLKNHDEIKRKLGVTNYDSFRDYLKGCIWLDILRQIANGSKHFERQPYQTQLVQGYGQGPYGIGPYGRGYLLIDLGAEDETEGYAVDEFGEPRDSKHDGGNQRYLPAAHLLEVCVRFWRDFFAAHRPENTVVPSRHHTLSTS